MATTEPVWTEAKIALTEKKMDMTLDDIITMSKVPTKGKKQLQNRASNKTTRNFAKGGAQDKPAKVRHYMDTRSAMRQEVLAQRRSNFQGNQFPSAARKASVAPLHNNRAVSWKPRAAAPFAQRRAGNDVGFGNKRLQRYHQQQQPQQPRQQANAAPMQRPQSLDLLLAKIKEQRMRRAQPRARHNNAAPRNRGGRFGNFPHNNAAPRHNNYDFPA